MLVYAHIDISRVSSMYMCILELQKSDCQQRSHHSQCDESLLDAQQKPQQLRWASYIGKKVITSRNLMHKNLIANKDRIIANATNLYWTYNRCNIVFSGSLTQGRRLCHQRYLYQHFMQRCLWKQMQTALEMELFKSSEKPSQIQMLQQLR